MAVSVGTRVIAAILDAPNAAPRLEELRIPELAEGGAILSTLYSEVCGTDVHIWRGRMPGVPFPIVPGHVTVGRLSKIRGRITDIDGSEFQEGDLVTFLDVHETCGHCFQCLVARQTTRCPSRKVYGITYGVGDGVLGGWADSVWLKPGLKIVRIPQQLDPATFIGGGCGLVTALHAVDRAEIRLGQTVVVLGAGPVGQSAVALSALSGAGSVVAIGGPDDRLEFARRMGATQTQSLEIPHAERVQHVRALTKGQGADVVIEAAGVAEAVTQALDLVRDGGRVIVAGQYADTGEAPLSPHRQINRKHVEVRGVWGSDYSHFHRAVQIATQFGSRIPWREQVSRQYALSQVGGALEAVEKREVLKALVAPGK